MPPSEKPREATKPSGGKNTVEENMGCAFMLALLYLVGIFVIPHLDPKKTEIETTAVARTSIAKTLSQSFPTAEIQLKQLGGFSLEVWIARATFESVAYLDRKALLDTVGKGWCQQFGGWNWPTIAVRDEKSGKELGSYHCLFSHAKIEQD